MKRFSIGLFAIILAAGFAAFTAPAKNTHTLNNNYRYMGSTDLLADRGNPLNYEFTATTDGCGDGEDLICIINAPGPSGTGAHPSFANGTDPYSNSAGVSVVSKKAQ